ncbi:hypothetical protein BJP23_17175 [Aeromonas veronii bv. veronii]|nr:hypothetical protein [Aeromonas veronii bv. veronii]OKP35640.1 hypothetical protein BJP23_17175 [Aeromonas veronii bv. veronii]
MKKMWYACACVTFLVLTLYFVQFVIYEIPMFSNKQGDWGSFGSYASGTLGPLFAFLAYIGIREQVSQQRDVITEQQKQKALDDHLNRTKETFEKIYIHSCSSIAPLERYCKISLANFTKFELSRKLSDIDTLVIIDDIIDAGRLLHGAEFVYKNYLHLIEQSVEHLDIECPLHEHKWVATTTWRGFQKNAMFINVLAQKAIRDVINPNQDMFSHEQSELLTYISACERWEKNWKQLGLGF